MGAPFEASSQAAAATILCKSPSYGGFRLGVALMNASLTTNTPSVLYPSAWGGNSPHLLNLRRNGPYCRR